MEPQALGCVFGLPELTLFYPHPTPPHREESGVLEGKMSCPRSHGECVEDSGPLRPRPRPLTEPSCLHGCPLSPQTKPPRNFSDPHPFIRTSWLRAPGRP